MVNCKEKEGSEMPGMFPMFPVLGGGGGCGGGESHINANDKERKR